MGRHADFWLVTSDALDALDYALDSFGMDDRELKNDLMESYLRLDCYPEVPGTLRRLKEIDLQTAILSNGSPAMLDTAITNSGLEGLVDLIFSVEEVGIYKPAPQVYQLASEQLGLAAGKIAFLSGILPAPHPSASGPSGSTVLVNGGIGSPSDQVSN